MKKFVVIIVFVLLFVSVLSVSAQYDLSGLSYEGLQEIVSQAQKEMMTRPEFQSVEVPTGLYTVGKEIPAGTWTITTTNRLTQVITGSILDTGNNEIKTGAGEGWYCLNVDSNNPIQNITLTEGYYVEVNIYSAIFSTPTGVSFSFK